MIQGAGITFDNGDERPVLQTRLNTGPVVITTPIRQVFGELEARVAESTSLQFSQTQGDSPGLLLKSGPGQLNFVGDNVGWLGSVVLQEGTLGLDGLVRFDSLSIHGGSINGQGRLELKHDLELREGEIEIGGPGLSGNVVKRGLSTATIRNLGEDALTAIQVERGILWMSSNRAFGPNTTATVPDRFAVLDHRGGAGRVVLNQSTGFANGGGLWTDRYFLGELVLNSGRSVVKPGSSGTTFEQITGPGALAIFGENAVFTNDKHTFTGATEIGVPGLPNASLILKQNGRLHSTSQIVINPLSSLVLDNDGGQDPVNLRDRVGDGVPIHLRGGEIIVSAAGINDAFEQFGDVFVESGWSSLEGNSAAELRMNSLQRTGAGVFSTGVGVNAHVGSGPRMHLNEAPVLDRHGIIGPWFTVSQDFATYHPEFGIVPLYREVQKVNSLAGVSPVSHVETQGAQPALEKSVTIATFRSDVLGQFDLGGHELNISSGGWINTGEAEVLNGRVTAGGEMPDAELILYTYPSEGPITVSADIVDNPGGSVGLTLASAAILSGHNSYSGPTTVLSGTVRIIAAESIPTNTSIHAHGRLSLEFESPEPIVVNQIRISDGGQIRGGGPSLSGVPDKVSIAARDYLLESGELEVNLSGSGNLRKTTAASASIGGDNRDYSGDIEIENGILYVGDHSVAHAPHALGTGTTRIYPGGILAHSSYDIDREQDRYYLTGNIELLGGELAISESTRPDRWVFWTDRLMCSPIQ